MAKEVFITKEIEATYGSSESSRVELVVSTVTGEAELVIEKTFTERYPVTDYDKVIQLHKDLNRGGGRRAYTLMDLTK